MVLDGEIAALDEKGRSSFQLIQASKSSDHRVPLVYYVFDLLFPDGKDLRGKSRLGLGVNCSRAGKRNRTGDLLI